MTETTFMFTHRVLLTQAKMNPKPVKVGMWAGGLGRSTKLGRTLENTPWWHAERWLYMNTVELHGGATRAAAASESTAANVQKKYLHLVLTRPLLARFDNCTCVHVSALQIHV